MPIFPPVALNPFESFTTRPNFSLSAIAAAAAAFPGSTIAAAPCAAIRIHATSSSRAVLAIAAASTVATSHQLHVLRRPAVTILTSRIHATSSSRAVLAIAAASTVTIAATGAIGTVIAVATAIAVAAVGPITTVAATVAAIFDAATTTARLS